MDDILRGSESDIERASDHCITVSVASGNRTRELLVLPCLHYSESQARHRAGTERALLAEFLAAKSEEAIRNLKPSDPGVVFNGNIA